MPNGIVLVTGPTGSGKSTTLYAALEAARDGLRKIITVEDPVEYQLPDVTQIQVRRRSASRSRRRCASCCATTRTSSSSARSGMRKRRRSRCRPH